MGGRRGDVPSAMATPPDFPVGPPPSEAVRSEAELREHIALLTSAPTALRACVAGLTADRLNTRYKNWSVRQIVQHVADSHVNVYTRFKLALTEEWPTIRPYDEGAWAALGDARSGELETSLSLLESVHRSWVGLIGTMSWDDFTRGYYHPDDKQRVPLLLSVPQYTWHGRHHTAQIEWLAREHRWR